MLLPLVLLAAPVLVPDASSTPTLRQQNDLEDWATGALVASGATALASVGFLVASKGSEGGSLAWPVASVSSIGTSCGLLLAWGLSLHDAQKHPDLKLTDWEHFAVGARTTGLAGVGAGLGLLFASWAAQLGEDLGHGVGSAVGSAFGGTPATSGPDRTASSSLLAASLVTLAVNTGLVLAGIAIFPEWGLRDRSVSR